MEYRDALSAAVEAWNMDPILDEWSFERFREEFVGNMSASEAFDSINETIDFLLEESDESTATEILQTIIGLARRSETTEVPSGLLSRKDLIEKQFIPFGTYAKNKLKELIQYYRLTS